MSTTTGSEPCQKISEECMGTLQNHEVAGNPGALKML